MLVYFKDKKTFHTTGKAIAQSWDMPIICTTAEGGSVTFPQVGDRKNYSGDWIYISGHLFLIDESTPQDGMIELKVSDPAHLFDRQLIFPNNPENTYGAFIANAITREFINCSDVAYRITYLTVLNEDSTAFEAPTINSDKIYSLFDVIALAREKGVILDFLIDGANLKIHIHTNTGSPHNVIFNDGHSELEGETFSRVKTAKITILKATDNEGEYTTTTWYLSSSGDISQSVPPSRAEGDWVYLTISKDEDPQTKAREKFKENISSHKIEFYSDRVYNLWDKARFKIDGEVLESSIVGIFIADDHSRYLYRCGDLATTLTEKVSKLQ